jgi:hypothetical protein
VEVSEGIWPFGITDKLLGKPPPAPERNVHDRKQTERSSGVLGRPLSPINFWRSDRLRPSEHGTVGGHDRFSIAQYSVGAAAQTDQLSGKRVAAARTRQTKQILDYAIGSRFCVPLLHKIGVQLAHRQPPEPADRLCLLHTGICWRSQLQLAHRYPSGLAHKLCLLQLTVIQADNLLALRSNQRGGAGRGRAKCRAIRRSNKTPFQRRSIRTATVVAILSTDNQLAVAKVAINKIPSVCC